MIDLHIHTTATPHHSSWAPAALAAAAAERGLRAFAVTDHNSIASLAEAQAAAQAAGVGFVPGVEIDSGHRGKFWHMLVYGFEIGDPRINALCESVFARNAADAERLITTLIERGFALGGLDALGRAPHVADVAAALARNNELPNRDAAESDEAAAMRYISAQVPGGYTPVGVDEVIATAHQCGAIAVLAHPGRSNGVYARPADDGDIAAMAALGLDGLEVFYPTHSAEQRAVLAEQAWQHRLLVSGGSDSHHSHQPLAAWDEPRIAPLLDRLRV